MREGWEKRRIGWSKLIRARTSRFSVFHLISVIVFFTHRVVNNREGCVCVYVFVCVCVLVKQCAKYRLQILEQTICSDKSIGLLAQLACSFRKLTRNITYNV